MEYEEMCRKKSGSNLFPFSFKYVANVVGRSLNKTERTFSIGERINHRNHLRTGEYKEATNKFRRKIYLFQISCESVIDY